MPAHGILHELLHVQRYWVEGVPQVMPIKDAPDNNWGVTSEIENCLEHQIIVPREADYGIEPYSYWNRTEEILWERYPWPDISEPFARRKVCLLGWLSVCRLVTDERVRSHAEFCLHEEGMLAEAERFRKKIFKTIHHKPSALSAAVRFLRIPRKDVLLVYMDVRNRQRVAKKIPLI